MPRVDSGTQLLELDAVENDPTECVDEFVALHVLQVLAKMVGDKKRLKREVARVRKRHCVEVVNTGLVVAEAIAGVKCLLGGDDHRRKAIGVLEDLGVLDEEDVVLAAKLVEVVGGLGRKRVVLLDRIEPRGKHGEHGLGVHRLFVLDEQVVGVVADDEDGGHVASCSKGSV